jgi:hypothetical protein
LRVPGTNDAIDRAVDQALERAGFQVIPLGEEFVKAWEQATDDGNTVAAAGAWMSDRQYRNKIGIAGRTKAAILLGQPLIVTAPAALAPAGALAADAAAVCGSDRAADAENPPILPPQISKIGLLEAACRICKTPWP